MDEFGAMHQQYMQTIADLQSRVAQAAVFALQQQRRIDALEKAQAAAAAPKDTPAP